MWGLLMIVRTGKMVMWVICKEELFGTEKRFRMKPEDTKKQVIINLDGIRSESTFFINGRKLFENKYGYTPFNININPFS